jgi:hypothetical protein
VRSLVVLSRHVPDDGLSRGSRRATPARDSSRGLMLLSKFLRFLPCLQVGLGLFYGGLAQLLAGRP